MAHSVDSRTLINGIDFSTSFTNVGSEGPTDEVETTTFQPGAANPAKAFEPGLDSGAFSADAIFNANLIDKLAPIFQARGGATVWTHVPTTDALGNPVRIAAVVDTALSQVSDVADVVKNAITGRASGEIAYGVVLHVLQAETATGDETAVDNAAGTTDGGTATLHVTAVSGAGTIDVIIEQSATGAFAGEETTLATFTQVTAVESAELVVVAPATTVQQFLRASFTIAGFTSVTFHVAFARRP